MPSTVSLVCVDPDRISDFWPHARPLIKAAIDQTDLTRFEDIETDVLDGNQLLWLAWNGEHIEAAATTQLYNSACILTACSGQYRERWLHLLEQIEKYAADEGCKTMRIYGRKGWERVLKGYRSEYMIMEKPIGRH